MSNVERARLKMTRMEQQKLVSDLVNRVAGEVLDVIGDGSTPAHWDGFELRQYVADRFAANVSPMGRVRMREYQNDVIVNNL